MRFLGLDNHRQVMARIGMTDEEEFREKMRKDAEFNKFAEVLDREISKQESVRELNMEVQSLKRKVENSCNCCCCCCGGCCK